MTPRNVVQHSREHRIIQAIAATVALVVLLVPPFVLASFQVRQITQVLVFAVAVLGLNLVTGYNGQVSLGHSAFVGLGAYTSAVLVADQGWSVVASIPVAAALSFVVGCLVGLPALRIRGHYLALITVTLAVTFPILLKRFGGLTGGANGKRVPLRLEPPAWTGLSAGQHHIWTYLLVLSVAALMFLFAHGLINSRVGRAIRSIRDNPTSAAANGINVSLYKTLTFGMSALFAGVAGVLHVMDTPFVSADSFELLLSIDLLIAMVVGGVGTLFGPIIGGLYLVYIPYFTAEIGDGAFASVISGSVLIFLFLVAPSGAMGVLRAGTGRFLRITAEPPAGILRSSHDPDLSNSDEVPHDHVAN
jgi:branched-chain amino acid transport system permease protein